MENNNNKTAQDWVKKGDEFYQQGRYEDAIASYDKALELEPNNAIFWNNRSYILYESGHFDEALISLDKTLALNKYNKTAWNNKGYILNRLGKYEDALVSLDKAIKLDKNSTSAWNNRGTSLLGLGRYKEAISNFDEAHDNNPNFVFSIAIFLQSIDVQTLQTNKKEFVDYIKKRERAFIQLIKKENTDIDNYAYLYLLSILIAAKLCVKTESASHYSEISVAKSLLFTPKDKENPKEIAGKVSNFRLNTATTSNDPAESKTLLTYLCGDEDIERLILNNEYATFIGCFTFNNDCLNQFRLYGKKEGQEATGISIEVKADYFEQDKTNFIGEFINNGKSINKNKEIKHSLYRCIYLDPQTGYINLAHLDEYAQVRKNSEKGLKTIKIGLEKIKIEVDGLIKELKKEVDFLLEKYKSSSYGKKNGIKEKIYSVLINLNALVKNIAFKEEQECRIVQVEKLTDKKVAVLLDNDGGYKNFYIEYLPMSEYVQRITLPPKSTDGQLWQESLQRENLTNVEVSVSRHPFKEKIKEKEKTS